MPAPQGEAFPKQLRGTLRVGGQRGGALIQQALEPIQVELARLHPQEVASAARVDAGLGERAPEPGHVDLEALAAVGGTAPPPEPLDQALPASGSCACSTRTATPWLLAAGERQLVSVGATSSGPSSRKSTGLPSGRANVPPPRWLKPVLYRAASGLQPALRMLTRHPTRGVRMFRKTSRTVLVALVVGIVLAGALAPAAYAHYGSVSGGSEDAAQARGWCRCDAVAGLRRLLRRDGAAAGGPRAAARPGRPSAGPAGHGPRPPRLGH